MARPRFNDRFSHVPLFDVGPRRFRDRKNSRPRTPSGPLQSVCKRNLRRHFEGAPYSANSKQFANTIKNFEINRAAVEQPGKQLAQALIGYQPRTAGNLSDGMSVRGSG